MVTMPAMGGQVRDQDLSRALFCGIDNLDVMCGMNSGSVDLIITDPPFKNNGEIYQGSGSAAEAKWIDYWTPDDVHGQWLKSIQEDRKKVHTVVEAVREAVSPMMFAYIAAMAARLLECHRNLRVTGSIYVHCDPDNSPYWRMLMDAIFGADNFHNEIIWKRTSGRSDARKFGSVHDVLLFYSKSKDYIWNPQYLMHDPEYIKKSYRNEDSLGRWQSSDITASGPRYGESGKPWRGIDPGKAGRHWSTPTQGGMNDFIVEHNLIPGWPNAYPSVHSRLDALDAVRLIHWPNKEDGMPCLKRYLASTKGNAVEDIIFDIRRLGGSSKEKNGWPTQKPLALYSRLIAASSNPGDIVFDPFCGSGTTLVAAESLSRKWIGIEREIEARSVVETRIPNLKLSSVAPTRTDDRRTAFDETEWANRALEDPPPIDTVYKSNNELRNTLSRVFGPFCSGCGTMAPKFLDGTYKLGDFAADHVIPRAKGGGDEFGNRLLLCVSCNTWKSEKYTLKELVDHNNEDKKMISKHLVDGNLARIEDIHK